VLPPRLISKTVNIKTHVTLALMKEKKLKTLKKVPRKLSGLKEG